jgi:hypothetical protein
MENVSHAEVAAFRLRRHHLTPRARPGALAQVARDVCGVQAQLPAPAELAFRVRVAGLTREQVRRALEQDRTLVRTWTVRNTVHVLTAEEFPVHIAAVRDASLHRIHQWLGRSGLTPDRTKVIGDAAVEALGDGPLTRRALDSRLVEILGPRDDDLMRPWSLSAVRLAACDGRICFGPNRGQESTYVRADQWLPDPEPLDPAEAQAALLRSYLRSYGPAVPADFSHWSALPAKTAQAAFARLRGELVEVAVDGQPAHLLSDDLESLRGAESARDAVSLLGHFDVFLLGHKDKGHLIAQQHYKKVYQKAGWINPVVLVGGRVAAVWSYRRSGRRLAATVEPFGKVSRKARTRIEHLIGDLAEFLSLDATVSYKE